MAFSVHLALLIPWFPWRSCHGPPGPSGNWATRPCEDSRHRSRCPTNSDGNSHLKPQTLDNLRWDTLRWRHKQQQKLWKSAKSMGSINGGFSKAILIHWRVKDSNCLNSLKTTWAECLDQKRSPWHFKPMLSHDLKMTCHPSHAKNKVFWCFQLSEQYESMITGSLGFNSDSLRRMEPVFIKILMCISVFDIFWWIL